MHDNVSHCRFKKADVTDNDDDACVVLRVACCVLWDFGFVSKCACVQHC